MDALAEAISGLLTAIFELAIIAVEMLAMLLILLLELLFVLVTAGGRAARERYSQRRQERRLSREGVEKIRPNDSTTHQTRTGKAREIVSLVVLLAIVSVGITFYVQNGIRKQKIEETQLQMTAIADDVFEQVSNNAQPPPASGRLANRDAWNRPVELLLREGVLGSRIVVLSDGPDQTTGTTDDIKAYRYIRNSSKEVAGKLTARGIDHLKDKVAGILPRREQEDGKSTD